MAQWHEPPLDRASGEWWACEQPERPSDEDMCIDVECCESCRIKALAVIAIEGDDGTLWYDMEDDGTDEDDGDPKTLTELVHAAS